MAAGKKTGGRVKGVPNKKTREAKEAIEQCFIDLGGVKALKEWAETNPDAFYATVWPKLLPVQHRLGGDPDNKTPVVFGWLTDKNE
jgi:hypothetical protein